VIVALCATDGEAEADGANRGGEGHAARWNGSRHPLHGADRHTGGA
jgi:hypothetical protein